MATKRKTLSIDIGTARFRLVMPKRGLVIDEPSLIIKDTRANQWLDSGAPAEARQMKLSRNEQIVRPFASGSIANYYATKELFDRAMKTSLGRIQLLKPDAITTIAGTASSTQRRALLDALREVGIRQTYVVPAIYAAALGSGIDISEPRGNMVIHLGAGVCEVAMFTLGTTIAHHSLRVGGDDLDSSLQQRIQRLHGIRITPQAARSLKESYVQLAPISNVASTRLKGTLVRKNTTHKVAVKNDSLLAAIEPTIDAVVRAARKVIEATPPELVADIIDSGVLLTGGLAELNGVDRYITKKLKVSCVRASEPALCAVRGANIATTYVQDYLKNVVATNKIS